MRPKTLLFVMFVMAAAFVFNWIVEPEGTVYYRDSEMGPDNDGY